jgi:hypothetical protein
MKRMLVVASMLLAALALPPTAYADDCSSLGDCVQTAQEYVGMIGLLIGGLAVLFGTWVATAPGPGETAESGAAPGEGGPGEGRAGEAGEGGADAGDGSGAGPDGSGDGDASGEGDGSSDGDGSESSTGPAGEPQQSMTMTVNADGSRTITNTVTSGDQQTSTMDVIPGSPPGSASPAPPPQQTGPTNANGGELGPDAGDQIRRGYDDGSYDIDTRNSDGGVTTDSFDANGNPTGTTTITTYPDGSQQAITTTADGKTTVIEHFGANGDVVDAAVVKENPDGSVTRLDLDVSGSTSGGDTPVRSSETVAADGTSATSSRNEDGSATTVYKDAHGETIGTVTIKQDATGTIYSYTGTDGATTTVVSRPSGQRESVGTTTIGPSGSPQTTVTTSDGTTMSSGGASDGDGGGSSEP